MNNDNEKLLSVGIDIGTATTQLIFSEISLENTSGYFTVPSISITDKRILYKSGIHFTPLLSHELIDSDKVKEIVQQEYSKAGIRPENVGTGAVIITGESARKENARAVMERLSEFAGEFVVSTAGPDLESLIAGKGSGAYEYSRKNHCRTINFDIGGGTTNIVVFDDGNTISKGCLDIGGRIIRVDENDKYIYISESADRAAKHAGVDIHTGQTADRQQIKRITDEMADVLMQAAGMKEKTSLYSSLSTPGSTLMEEKIDGDVHVFFSGGVANFIKKDQETGFPYGDIGAFLGRSIAETPLFDRKYIETGSETIRATVVGAGMYTTTISGSTITYTNELFPLKNIPIIKLTPDEQDECFDGRNEKLKEHIRWFQNQSDRELIMLSMNGRKNPGYAEIAQLADALSTALDELIPDGLPMLITVECDIAKALGVVISRKFKGRRDVVCIDCIRTEDGDYIDLGRPIFDGMVIPVIVKSLLFG